MVDAKQSYYVVEYEIYLYMTTESFPAKISAFENYSVDENVSTLMYMCAWKKELLLTINPNIGNCLREVWETCGDVWEYLHSISDRGAQNPILVGNMPGYVQIDLMRLRSLYDKLCIEIPNFETLFATWLLEDRERR